MTEVKSLPYGISDFKSLRRDNSYYADKTMYLPLLEETGNYLFLIRPRRFGKSLFVSMMQCYYDMAGAADFDRLFDGLWIKNHPTKLKNAFQVLYFDFSKASPGNGSLEDNFDNYISTVCDRFIETYRNCYDEEFYAEVKNGRNAAAKLHSIDSKAHAMGIRLYLIIDEYDNFTNVILSEGGTQTFKRLTHASGFYREYFKLFKAMFDRVFLIGVSPVTLDDLTSGYNIDWNISQDPRFNAMLGFSDSEVRTMFGYYKDNGRLPDTTDIDAEIEKMRPWYNNYCFSEDALSDERVFNSDMVLYYLRSLIVTRRPPKEMVDKNVRTDYSKLKMLAGIERKRRSTQRLSIIEGIAATGEIYAPLKTSFPADRITDDDNFCSLIYYYGMLTMGGMMGNYIKMVIPNNTVREQFWAFLRDNYEQTEPIISFKLDKAFLTMAYEGNPKPLMSIISEAYKANSSVRDSILGEHNLQGFFKAYLALTPIYLVWPEHELNYGYSDFLLIPDLEKYPGTGHSYIIELKYVKPDATGKDVRQKCLEAAEQLKRYAADSRLIRQCGNTRLHLLTVVFKGPEMTVCEEIQDSMQVKEKL